jgi:hypothetical protein
MQAETHSDIGPGEIGNGALVMTVDTGSWLLTAWTGTLISHGLQLNRDGVGVAIDAQILDTKAGAKRQKMRKQIHG